MPSKGGKQFGRTVLSGMRNEQVRKEIKTVGFEVTSSMGGPEQVEQTTPLLALAQWPRVRETKAVDDAGGADMVA